MSANVCKQIVENTVQESPRFSDVGNHFRAGYTLGYWGVSLLATAGVEKATWVFAPEGHGKGVCDGQGGRITGWLNTIAKKTVVSTLVQFCRLLSKSAEAAEALNPGGPKSRFHLFKPPPKATLPKCYVDTKGLNEGGAPIRSIYAWSFTMNSSKMRPRPVWAAHPLASMPSDRRCNPAILEVAPEGAWRTAYRTKEPENMKLKLGTLRKGWARLQKLNIPLSCRRRTWVDWECAFGRPMWFQSVLIILIQMPSAAGACDCCHQCG